MIGVPVGEEFRVNTTTMGFQSQPNVAVDAQGNYVVVWKITDLAEGNADIFAQRYDRFGNALGGEIEVAAALTGVDEPVVGMDVDGNFVVVWTDEKENENDVDARRFDRNVKARRFDRNGNALGDSFRVNTETTEDQETPDIAMNANGQFVITWDSFGQDGSFNGIFAQAYDPTGNPVGGEIAVNNITNSLQVRPTVGIDNSGNFVIAWEDLNDRSRDIGEINARRFDSAGTPLGDSFLVNTVTERKQDTPDIAMNASGEFVITWESFGQDGDGSGVFAQKYNSAGEKIGDEITVNTTTIENQGDPSVAIDADGNFLITWESLEQDGDGRDVVGRYLNNDVFGQYFDNTGTKQGTEFRINTLNTEGDQQNVAVAIDPNGNAIVAWQSFRQDSDSTGIFAQQLAVPASIEFSQPTFTLNEDGSIIGAQVTLTRDNDLIESELQVSVTGGTATPGLDFTNIFPLTVTFAPGDTTQTLSIPVLQDALAEGTETLNLTLTPINNAEVGTQSSATVNIIEALNLRLQGSRNDDRLRGGAGNDIIFGLAGNDILRGLAGADRLFGGNGNDRLIGDSGNDRLIGNRGNDQLIGQSGNDILMGGKDSDRLRGDAGRDELIGGRGNDVLIGGADGDIFVLRNQHGTDLIRDFNIG
ncbi:MAG: Calx-beta domain-containing protein, partial [Cyanobacteria bacterium J06627_8]